MAKLKATVDAWGIGSALIVLGFLLLCLWIMSWLIGGILSITLGDLLIYAIIFGIGYAVGSNK